jgi:hypothetical protein
MTRGLKNEAKWVVGVQNRGNHTIAPSYFDSPKSVSHFTLKVGFPIRPESEDLALRYRDT